MPLNQTSTFELWPTSITNNDTPTEQDWCTAEVNGKNQVCPFGVGTKTATIDGTTTTVCKDCPFDWVIANSTATDDSAKRCCPSGWALVNNNTSCCPSGYNYQNNKCVDSNSNTTKPKTATKISSIIMGDKFPESGTNTTVSE